MTDSLIVYHRCGGKSLHYPPNTIFTAQWASKHGAKAIEYDVVLAQDGDDNKIVVVEPKVLKEAGLDIDDLRFTSVRDLDAGNQISGFQKIPLFEEMISSIDDKKTGHQIHIKGTHPDTVRTLLPKLTGLSNYLITAFDISVIKEVRSIDKTVPVGWLMKQTQEAGNEGGVDLTAKLQTDPGGVEAYSDTEITEILNISKQNSVDTILLCGPRIKNKAMVQRIKDEGFGVGAWGVATNLQLAKRLANLGLDRFTLDNPEELNQH